MSTTTRTNKIWIAGLLTAFAVSVCCSTVTGFEIVPRHLQARPGNPDESISFYAVPLVCGADTNIGCGSRSKPALLELERHPLVKEAWLNRRGTVLAVVWKGKVGKSSVVKPIFDRNEITFTELNSREAAPYRVSFRQSGLWYRGAEVDALSIEEAGTIAESAVRFAREHKLVTPEEAESIKTDVKQYFAEELLKIRTNDQLDYDSRHTFTEAILRIAEKHIGRERTLKAMELYHEYSGEGDTQDESGEGSRPAEDRREK